MRPRTLIPADMPELRRAERALAGLSPVEREMLALSAGTGLRNREIAAKLGISERRAERILARALRRFSRALEEHPRPWWRLW
jgi:RNA polymerase sigma factor (sigma-70 family)